MATTHLPQAKSLSEILPRGSESGKEFGRVVSLLLFADARHRGKSITLFDDRSGDFAGLDAYEPASSDEPAIGYQFKFFPSPFSDGDRSAIRASILDALTGADSSRIKRFIIVTPDDLINSGRRAGGGDVEWLSSLQEHYRGQIEIDHYGHTKLISLFMNAPNVCLHYYPQLVTDGTRKRRAIAEIREVYDKSLREKLGKIEFVGMSVYKEETSRRVPLEEIYIPLSVIPERSPPETDDTPRMSPLQFIRRGSNAVILGDPGSGKSTLLSFLALSGLSAPLQARCGTQADTRLPVLIVLRRYADELKTRRNLGILEYIAETVRADFSIPDFDVDFLRYWADNGDAIFLFDGVDELPSSSLKSLIRERVDGLKTSFPGNTVIVTSRLVGYEAGARFGTEYDHRRVAKLRLDEINKFVRDWYKHRMDDPNEWDRNANDLINVISQPDSEPIRDLARNPLLLTIVALVHRVDAVLPDQRVVLYQKCTETLLNTWYRAKLGDDEIIKGRIEKRNRNRIEAIANWMHSRLGSSADRAVARYDDILNFLINHIKEAESQIAGDDPIEDQAEEFLAFVRSKAGLLIEAGEGFYSFVHLTFQEYLTATWLISYGEVDGAGAIWSRLEPSVADPRWHEVLRLLMASLKNPSAQRLIMDHLTEKGSSAESAALPSLLLGLIRDGVEPAEERVEQILRICLSVLLSSSNYGEILDVISSLESVFAKQPTFSDELDALLSEGIGHSSGRAKLRLVLVAASLGRLNVIIDSADVDTLKMDGTEQDCFAILYDGAAFGTRKTRLWTDLSAVATFLGIQNAEGNLLASLLSVVPLGKSGSSASLRLAKRELSFLALAGFGPHQHHIMNLGALAYDVTASYPELRRALDWSLQREREGTKTRDSGVSDEWKTRRSHELSVILEAELGSRSDDRDEDEDIYEIMRDRLRRRVRGPGRARELRDWLRGERAHSVEGWHAEASYRLLGDPGWFRRSTLQSTFFSDGMIELIVEHARLSPRAQWKAALARSLREDFLDSLSSRFRSIFDAEFLRQGRGTSLESERGALLAWAVMLDIWIWENRGYDEPGQSPLSTAAEIARQANDPLLNFLLAVRDFVYGSRGAATKLKRCLRTPEVRRRLQLEGWPVLREIPDKP